MRKLPSGRRSFSKTAITLGLLVVSGGVTGCGLSESKPSWSLLGNDNAGIQTGSIDNRNWANRPPSQEAVPAHPNTHTYQPRYQPAPIRKSYLPPPAASQAYQQAPTQSRPLPFQRSPQNSILVRRGDTLYAISRRTGISVPQLFAINKLSSEKIYPGQVIFLR